MRIVVLGVMRKGLWLGLGFAAVVAVALMVTSLGVAADSPSAADTGRSVAAHVTSTASGQCSKAEAIVAVRRLGLRDVSPDYPVYKVLCGAFTGAGSQTMVALISGPDNVGMLYWAVFRWFGSEWRFLMKQRHAAVLAASGSDIRETVSIYRPDDSRCCPSGGMRTRIWHWDGSQFASSPWKHQLASDAFFSPSGNIFCWMRDDDESVVVGCETFSSPHHTVKMGAEGRLKIRRPAAQCGCVPDGPRTLGYGRQITVGRFRCLSLEIGVKCTVIQSGKGFLINRAGVSRVGL